MNPCCLVGLLGHDTAYNRKPSRSPTAEDGQGKTQKREKRRRGERRNAPVAVRLAVHPFLDLGGNRRLLFASEGKKVIDGRQFRSEGKKHMRKEKKERHLTEKQKLA